MYWPDGSSNATFRSMAVMLWLRCTRGLGIDRRYPLSGHWIVLPDASCSTPIEPVTSVSAAASSGSPCACRIARTADGAGLTDSRYVLQHKPDEFTGERLKLMRVVTGVQWRHLLLGKMAAVVAIIVRTLSSISVAMLCLCICFLQFSLPRVNRTVTISVDAAVALHDSSLASVCQSRTSDTCIVYCDYWRFRQTSVINTSLKA